MLELLHENDGLLFQIRAGKYDAGPGKVDHRDKGVEHLLLGQFTTRSHVSLPWIAQGMRLLGVVSAPGAITEKPLASCVFNPGHLN